MANASVVWQVDSISSDALFVLLVEKDAAFMRLAEDRFYNTYPCIIMTAKGQPDVASRSAQLFHPTCTRLGPHGHVMLSGLSL